MNNERVLAYVGSMSLYLKAVDVYTEAVASSTKISKNLQALFSAKINEADPVGLPDLDNLVDGVHDFALKQDDKFLQKPDQKSYSFLKAEYDFFGVAYPKDGFFDVNYGPTNWWEKTTQFNNGVFSYVHTFKYDPKAATLTSGDATINVKNKLNFDELSFGGIEDDTEQSLTKFLIDKATARFVEEHQDSPLSDPTKIAVINQVYLVDPHIRHIYFLLLENGLKIKPNPDGTATLFARVLFDAYGAQLANSLVKFTGFNPIPMIPSGIRKSFLVKNFLGGIDSVDKYFKELGTPTPETDVTLTQLKSLKSLFKQVAKTAGLGSDSTVNFIFNDEYKFLGILDGDNNAINSPDIKKLLKSNVELNKTITYLNYINCQMGGNISDEIPKAEEFSSPFSLGPPEVSQKELNAENKKLNSKAEFTGDVTLRNVLRGFDATSEGKGVSSIYDQFLNKVDIHALAAGAKTSLASQLSGDQVKKIKFHAFIESLDVTEIIDCIVEPLAAEDSEFAEPLAEMLYDAFAFFYNAAKLDEPEFFNFITKDKYLPMASGGFSIPNFTLEDNFPYILMVPEKQKNKIFDTIIINNPQYKNSAELIGRGFVEVSDRTDFSPSEFVTFILRRAVLQYVEILEKTIEPEAIPEADPPQTPEQEKIWANVEAASKEVMAAKKFMDDKLVDYQLYLNDPDDDPDKIKANTEHEAAFKDWEDKLKVYNALSDQYAATFEKSKDSGKKDKKPLKAFERFFSEVSKKNKKLKESFKNPKLSDSDLAFYNSQQKSKNKIAPSINFGWFNSYLPTLDYTGTLSSILREGFELAMVAILSQLAQSVKDGVEKENNGDSDNLGKVDPSAVAMLLANSPVQNIIDSFGNDFNSPDEVISAIANSLFPPPPDMTEGVKCFLTNFANEVDFFTQAQLFKNPTSLNNPDIEIVRNICVRCGLPSDDSSITKLLLKLSELIDKDLLELKLKELNEAFLQYLDVCIDPNENYIENLKKFLDDQSAKDQASNESDAAAQKLLDLLSLLDGDKIKNLKPNLYCKFGSSKKALFDDQYPEVILDSQNQLVSSLLQDTNAAFNNDIGRFKSIILKQDDLNPIAALGLGANINPENGKDIGNYDFGKFLEKINKNEIGTPGQPSPSNSKKDVIQSELKKFEDLVLFFDNNKSFYQGFTDDFGANIKDISSYTFKTGGLKIELFISTHDSDQFPGDKPVPANTVMLYVSNVFTGRIVFEKQYGTAEDFFQGQISLFDINTPNSWFKKMSEKSGLGGKKNLINILKNFLSAEKYVQVGFSQSEEALDDAFNSIIKMTPDNDLFPKIFQNVLSGLIDVFIESYKAFTDEAFLKIPLKDFEAKTIWPLPDKSLTDSLEFAVAEAKDKAAAAFAKIDADGDGNIDEEASEKDKQAFDNAIINQVNAEFTLENASRHFFKDNGILTTPEVFDEFKVLRSNLQCFIEETENPDSFQVAKLFAVYQSLFNVLITRELLNYFFILNVKGSTSAFADFHSFLKDTLAADIFAAFNGKHFADPIFKSNFKKDLLLLYKNDRILQGEPPKLPQDINANESIPFLVSYFVEKYYITILDKIKKRISLSLSDFGNVDFTNTVAEKPLYSSVSYTHYTSFETDQWNFSYDDNFLSSEEETYNTPITRVPVFTLDDINNPQDKINNGFVVQTFVNIEQKAPNGTAPAEAFLNPEVDGFKGIAGNYGHYIFSTPSTKVPDNFRSYGNKSGGANGKNFYQLPGAQGEYWPVPDFEKKPEIENGKLKEVYKDYLDTFLRTQGKISENDFLKFYKQATTKFWGKMPDGSINLDAKVKAKMESLGPDAYFDKASAGVRLCLVLDYQDSFAQSLRKVFEDLFYYNSIPQLPWLDKGKQIKSLFDEKVFFFENASAPGKIKVLIPLLVKEKDFLPKARTHWQALLDNPDLGAEFEVDGVPIVFASADNWLLSMYSEIETFLFQLKSPASQQYKDHIGSLKTQLKGMMNEELFLQFVPFIMKDFFDGIYGDKLSSLFDSTLKDIMGQINASNSVIDEEWKNPATENSGLGEDESGSGEFDKFNYTPLIMAALPLVIMAAATYSDPTWKTPWYYPGPQTPLGYLAKILSYSQ